MKRVLVVEDETRIRALIKEHLEANEYRVVEASDGKEALDWFRQDPEEFDAVILDVMMPELDGWTVCREIRRMSQVPVIMLTARGEEYDRLFGFELGVDDYVVKPFSPKELMARLGAVLRRGVPSDPAGDNDRIHFQGLVVDMAARRVTIEGRPVKMTPREFELLQFLVRHPGQAFSRDQLLTKVWGYDFMGDDRTVDTHVKMLRESIKPYRHWIVTVWGHGYKFEAEDPS